MMHTITDLKNLRIQVVDGSITTDDLKAIQRQHPHTMLASHIEAYLLSGKSGCLYFTNAEAFRAVVYRTHLAAGRPVMHGGEIVASPAINELDGDLSPTFTRPLLFSELLTLTWSDDPIERIQVLDRQMERVRHAPTELEWDGTTYQLLCETGTKSFYWPTTLELPPEIKPWLTSLPQDRASLSTVLKRQGYPLNSLAGIRITEDMDRSAELDLGVWVLNSNQINKISDELGVSAEASQATVWFEDGSFFKGTIQSNELAGIEPGIYGGFKHPSAYRGKRVSTRGAIMDNYTLLPWKPSVNRQQTDYAGIDMPVRADLPEYHNWSLAATGYPPYVDRFNDQMIAAAAKLFRKAKVPGYAGKVALGTSQHDVQFIVRGPSLKPGLKEMVFLFSPSLPVHTSLMKVQVEMVQDKSLDDNLIQLNVANRNRDWVDRWFLKWAGRDCDGDGITLTYDPLLMQHARHWDDIQWIDTTQYKSQPDLEADDEEAAIRTSSERVRLFGGRIGIYDKIARRIIRHNPRLMSWDLRVSLSEAIQRSISSQKKNAWKSDFEGYSWITRHLPEGYEDWLFSNVHDRIDEVSVATKAWLRERAELRRSKKGSSHVDISVHDAHLDLQALLNEVATVMSEHVDAAWGVLSQIQTTPAQCYRQMRNRGRQLWSKHQARTDTDTIKTVFEFIVKARNLWSVSRRNGEHDNLRYTDLIQVIWFWFRDLMEQVDDSMLIIGAILTELPTRLIGNLLSRKTLDDLGLLDGYYLPVSTRMISPGMVLTTKELGKLLVHPNYLWALDQEKQYRVDKIELFSGIDWSTRHPDGHVQSTHLIKVKEVR
ncbi:hypothetical protein ACFL5M_04140 [Candidatus Neomarinimicrobiota bacterium]